jgi:hypothetical protein
MGLLVGLSCAGCGGTTFESAGSGGASPGGANGEGGVTSSGGRELSTGEGGRPAETGGALSSGGSADVSGGAATTGGSTTGGSPTSGGSPMGGHPVGGSATGGSVPPDAGVPTGGIAATGGTPASGGNPASGGVVTSGGGTSHPTGGFAPTGGTPASGGMATGGWKTGGTPATGGVATGGRMTGGTPATGGTSTGGTSTGGIGGTGGYPECATAKDCVLLTDCCSCLPLPVGSTLPVCNLMCIQSNCDARGIRTEEIACIAGRCVFARSCNPPGSSICAAPVPQCAAGEVPLLLNGCPAGGCARVEDCADVASCDVCNAAGVPCATFQAMPTSHHCVTTPRECGDKPTCACMGICNGAGLSCVQPDSTNLTCQCPGC